MSIGSFIIPLRRRLCSSRLSFPPCAFVNAEIADDDDVPSSTARSSYWRPPPLLGKLAGTTQTRTKVVKALFYALQVFYSFFIM